MKRGARQGASRPWLQPRRWDGGRELPDWLAGPDRVPAARPGQPRAEPTRGASAPGFAARGFPDARDPAGTVSRATAMSRSPRLRAAFVPPGPLLGGDSGRPPATPLSQVLALTGHWSGGPGLPSLPAADHGTTHPPLHPAQLPPQAQLATLPLPPRRSSGLPGGSVWRADGAPSCHSQSLQGGPGRVYIGALDACVLGPRTVCIGAPDRVQGAPARLTFQSTVAKKGCRLISSTPSLPAPVAGTRPRVSGRRLPCGSFGHVDALARDLPGRQLREPFRRELLGK